MARIAHLSDIHFGANDPKIVDAATAWLEERQPDLVVISGDFTQRARVDQFRQAAAWLGNEAWPMRFSPDQVMAGALGREVLMPTSGESCGQAF